MLTRKRDPEQARRNAAYYTLRKALWAGQVVRPDWCECCGERATTSKDGRATIKAHWPDYSRPLMVTWLCSKCLTLFVKESTKCKPTAPALPPERNESGWQQLPVWGALSVDARGGVSYRLRCTISLPVGEEWDTCFPSRYATLDTTRVLPRAAGRSAGTLTRLDSRSATVPRNSSSNSRSA